MPRISFVACIVLLFTCIAVAKGPGRKSDSKTESVTVKLRDGSTIVARLPKSQMLFRSPALKTSQFSPSHQWQRIVAIETDNVFHLHFANQDRLTASFAESNVSVETAIGKLKIPVSKILEIEVHRETKHQEKSELSPSEVLQHGVPQVVLPPMDSAPTREFAGLPWQLWRTDWETKGKRLTALGRVRSGFQYGHWGKGRGGFAVTGNGDKSWRDYEFAFDFKMLPATRDFFHASIPGESRGMHVYLRAKSLTESWNEPDTAYVIGVNVKGGWSLAAYEDFYYHGPGWTPAQGGKVDHYLEGKMKTPFRDDVNRIRVRAEGKQITLWINDELLTEFEHDEDAKVKPIQYGGFGVEWRLESLGWIENLTYEKLNERKNRSSD